MWDFCAQRPRTCVLVAPTLGIFAAVAQHLFSQRSNENLVPGVQGTEGPVPEGSESWPCHHVTGAATVRSSVWVRGWISRMFNETALYTWYFFVIVLRGHSTIDDLMFHSATPFVEWEWKSMSSIWINIKISCWVHHEPQTQPNLVYLSLMLSPVPLSGILSIPMWVGRETGSACSSSRREQN